MMLTLDEIKQLLINNWEEADQRAKAELEKKHEDNRKDGIKYKVQIGQLQAIEFDCVEDLRNYEETRVRLDSMSQQYTQKELEDKLNSGEVLQVFAAKVWRSNKKYEQEEIK